MGCGNRYGEIVMGSDVAGLECLRWGSIVEGG